MKKLFVSLLLVLSCVLVPLFSAEPRSSNEPLEIIHSNLKLILYPQSMSFSLYQLSDIGKGRYTALFEDRNAAATSWFSVQTDAKVFKLARRLGKSGVLEQTIDGARFVFDLTDDFQAIQTFSFVDSKDPKVMSLLKIDTSIENTSGKPGKFALKAFIDTILGETQGIHFKTDVQNRISIETRIDTKDSIDSVLISQNKESSFMILLKGFGVSVPSSVYVANWDRLNTLSWTHDFLPGRSFNSLYAINDSAVSIYWPSVELNAGEVIVYSSLMGSYSDYWIQTEQKASQTPVPNNSATSSVVDLIQLQKIQNSKQQNLVEKVLERIVEIEMNPDDASEMELEQLNNALDVLLNQN